jgi:hypothetical protein
MPFHLVTAGTSLQAVQSDGTISTLTLPTDIQIKSGTRARFAVLERYVIGVNAFTGPIFVDPDGFVYPLALGKPHRVPTVAAGAADTLTGTFRVKMAFGIKDSLGQVLSLGPMSNASDAVTTVNQLIALTNILVSKTPAVNFRRFWRTATNGTQYFEWFDLDDNTTTTISMGGADESLGTVAETGSDLVQAPARITNICEWKGRLWATTGSDVDTLYGGASRKIYGWPLSFPVRPVGGDKYGITGFLPRRDELGVGKRGLLWKMTGDSDANFRLVKVVEGKGPIAPDSCVVIRDVGYFLGDDGVYTWGNEGVTSITDDNVHPWFNTDDYFNRSEFKNAVGGYDPRSHSYLLFLAAVGQTTLTKWAQFDIANKRWLGPHTTTAFTPTATAGIKGTDSNDVIKTFVGGSDGYLYHFVPGNFTDGTATAIDFDVTGKFHAGKPPAPLVEHFWGRLFVASKIFLGGTLTITPKIGWLDASAGTAVSHDLTVGEERLGILGTGKLCQLRFRENTAGQGCEIYGYELPWHELGLRK